MAITIIKKAIGTFEHVEGGLSKIDGYPNATGIGELVDFKTRNGAILYYQVPVDEISIVDETTSTTYPPHATVVDLFQTLRAIGYFTMATSGGSQTLAGLLDTDIFNLQQGDVLTFNGTIWVNKQGGSGGGGVIAVNGDTGPEVWLSTNQIPEGNNLYFTQARVSENQDVQDAVTHIGDTNNPHNVTKSQVGLGNVDNTSDANKPISNAQQAAFDLLTEETAIVVNRDFNTVTEANNDIALNDLIANYPNRPAGVFNQTSGRIYIYDWNTSQWRDSTVSVTAQEIIDALGYVPARDDKIFIQGNEFSYRPVLGNPGSDLQTGDIAYYGWIDQTTFGKILSFSGTPGTALNDSAFTDWDIIEQI